MNSINFDPATDYYALLQVPETATRDDILRAYRRAMKSVHPDRKSGAQRALAEEQAKTLNVAFTVLSRPELRHQYDSARKAELVQEQIMGRYASGLGGQSGQDHYALIRDEVARQRQPLKQQNDRSATASILLIFAALAVIAIGGLVAWAILERLAGTVS